MATISKFYKNLRDLCEQNNMTVNELAQALNLSTGSPTAWKNGAIPRPATIEKIAAYFGVSSGAVLGTETKKAPTENGERQISNDESKFALWGDCDDIDEDDLADVLKYAAFVRERKKKK